MAGVSSLDRVCDEARAASRVLARLTSLQKDVVLGEMAEALERRAAEIPRENRRDVEAARRGHADPELVDSVEAAVEHIARHGSGHSEAIVTGSLGAARRFRESVDAAVVYVNASPRITEADELGGGPPIPVSTRKLHVRGPINLEQLTTDKLLVTGDGHVG